MKIYIVSHKAAEIPSCLTEIYQVLQAGAANRPHFAELADDIGDNISELNPVYNELTGLYWVWKNSNEDIVGLCHYRRFFVSGAGKVQNLLSGKQTGFLKEKKIRNILGKHDMIIHNQTFVLPSNQKQYEKAMGRETLGAVEDAIAELCPEYGRALEWCMNSRRAHLLNMFIARKEVCDRYCEWLFPILFEAERKVRKKCPEQNMLRAMGMAGERLLDVWLQKNQIDYREMYTVHTEKITWKMW